MIESVARSAGSPRALALILAGHAILLGAVLTTKMSVAPPAVNPVTTIINIAVDPPPDPQPVRQPPQPRPQSPAAPQRPFIDTPPAIVDMGNSSSTLIVPGPASVDLGPLLGPAIVPDPPRQQPARSPAVSLTPEQGLRPPYPNDKLREGEEATLRLRLTIDARGRVTAVSPVGNADPSFLAAARRHIMRAWRYRPATEDGMAVGSNIMVSLSFRLEEG